MNHIEKKKKIFGGGTTNIFLNYLGVIFGLKIRTKDLKR